ncbi:hypothetical protein JMJ77_0011210, partial [Colletotrichum scovillei]
RSNSREKVQEFLILERSDIRDMENIATLSLGFI